MIIKNGKYEGSITIPSSKSQTIRALLLATFSYGVSTILHPLYSEDTKSCLSAIKAMGVIIDQKENGDLTIDSSSAFKNFDSLFIDAGNSGTTEYLSLPLLSSLPLTVTMDGDEQLRKRPVKPLLNTLEDLGVKTNSKEGYPPLTIQGPLMGGESVIECKTSQYYSGLLLGAPLATKDTHIKCSLLYEKPYVEMTLDWMRRQGIEFKISDDLEEIWIKGKQSYKPFTSYIEGDFSSATFFFALAAIQGTTITVKGLDRESRQGDKDVLKILDKMGCKIEWKGMEVSVTGPKELKGGSFDLNAIPDSLPALSIVASFAIEDVTFFNVPQARIKETDRISVMKENLERMGVRVEEMSDGMIIHGKGRLTEAKVKGYGDHRVIMALSIAGTVAKGDIDIDDTSAVAVTFPEFFTLLKGLEA